MRGGGFGDLADFWTEGLPLTIAGKQYVVPEPDAENGLWLQTLWSAGVVVADALSRGEEPDAATAELAKLDDKGEADLRTRVLGEELMAELEADGVSPTKIKHMVMTGFYWIVLGEEPAKAYWQGRSPLEAMRPTPGNREERRAAAKSSRSTRTPAASATQKPGSRSGTKSLPTKPTSSKVTATRSRGSNSSSDGRSSKPTSTRSTASTRATKKV